MSSDPRYGCNHLFARVIWGQGHPSCARRRTDSQTGLRSAGLRRHLFRLFSTLRGSLVAGSLGTHTLSSLSQLVRFQPVRILLSLCSAHYTLSSSTLSARSQESDIGQSSLVFPVFFFRDACTAVEPAAWGPSGGARAAPSRR